MSNKFVNRARQSDFSSPPRRNSEEWHEQQQRVDASVAFIDDHWLYHWTERGEPPEPFRHHKTLFRQCTISDISKNGWAVLKLAVGDLCEVFGVQLRESDFKTRAGQRPNYEAEWLMLKRYNRCPCCLGIYGDGCVVAAAKASQQIAPFVPVNQYTIIRKNPGWKHLRFQAGYRHFLALFDMEYSFFASRQHFPCSITYGIDICVHGWANVWAVLNVDGVVFPAPFRIALSSDLADLPGTVDQISESCESFVVKLGASYLEAIDSDSVYDLICGYTQDTEVPYCVKEDLRTNPQLDRCLTRLDVLLVLMKAMNFRLEDDGISSFISLTEKFIPLKKENRHDTF